MGHMQIPYGQLAPGAWFIHGERLHCRSSLDNVLTVDMGGNFVTDTFHFRDRDLVSPESVSVTIRSRVRQSP